MAPRSLFDTLACDISDFHRERLRIIDDTDFSYLHQIIRGHYPGCSPEVEDGFWYGLSANKAPLDDEGILALKQNYALAILDPWNMHAIPHVPHLFWLAHQATDEDGSAHIKFCETCFGSYLLCAYVYSGHDVQMNTLFDRDRNEYCAECLRRFFRYVNWDLLGIRLDYNPTSSHAKLACTYINEACDKALFDNALLPARAEYRGVQKWEGT